MGATTLAPGVGFEPTTNRLTADRSTTELPRNNRFRLKCGGRKLQSPPQAKQHFFVDNAVKIDRTPRGYPLDTSLAVEERYLALHFAFHRALLEADALVRLIFPGANAQLHLHAVGLPVQLEAHQRVPLDVS